MGVVGRVVGRVVVAAAASLAALSPAGAATPVLLLAVVVASGYLMGSVPVAVLVARRHGVDIRAAGDRNPGFWNAKQLLGRRAALPVLAADLAKGALAAGLGVATAHGIDRSTAWWWLGYAGGAAAMAGHAWPLFGEFRGGRSVLTFVGAFVVIAPAAAFGGAAIGLVLLAVSRRFSLAARLTVFALPLVQVATGRSSAAACTLAMLCLIGLRFAQAA